MARSRYVKPEFFTDSELCELSPLHRLLYQALWLQADRDGILEDKPKELKVKCLPYDECDVDAMLWDLADAGRLVRYEVAGKRFIHLPKLGQHQHFHKDEKPRGFPSQSAGTVRARCQHGADTVPTPEEPHANTPLTLTLTDNSNLITTLSGKPDLAVVLDPVEPAPDDDTPPPSDQPPLPPEPDAAAQVFDYWRERSGHVRAKFDDKRKRAVRARLRDGYSAECLCRAVDGCLATPHNRGENERGERFDDLELICRSGSQVDRFARNALDPPKAKHRGPVHAWAMDPNAQVVGEDGQVVL